MFKQYETWLDTDFNSPQFTMVEDHDDHDDHDGGEEGHHHDVIFDPATGLYSTSHIYVLGYGADAALGSTELVAPYNNQNKADLDYDAAAVQLTRELRKFGDGIYNNGGNELGTSSSISWSFTATPDAGFSQVDMAQMAFIIRAFDYVSDVADVSLSRIGTGTSGAAAFSDDGDIGFTSNPNPPGNVAGQASYSFYPSVGDQLAEHLSADIWIFEETDYIEDDDFGMSLILHEIGHALGLSHPSEYSGQISYDDSAEYFQDSLQYTVMSYFSETNTGADHFEFVLNDAGTEFIEVGGSATNFMLHDIAALQRLYGADMTTRTGDTVYGFNSNTGDASWELSDKYDSIIAAVWDAGGIDTLDLSGFETEADVDLREEAFSSFGYLTWNFSIARGVIIENAIGGTADDSLLGNAANNDLKGLGGADTLNGAEGDDALTGGLGDDTLIGGAGTDTIFYAGVSTDYTIADIGFGLFTVTDNAGNDGVDTVSDDVEFITFSDGTFAFEVPAADGEIYLTISADNFTGTVEDDVIYALDGDDKINASNGNDTVYGGEGADQIIGGNGADLIDGGNGIDQARYANSNAGVIVDLFASTASGGHATGDTLVNIEDVFGSRFNDILTGDSGDNVLTGFNGDDVFAGGAGTNTFIGGNGNDTFIGGIGANFNNGGGGFGDVIDYSGSFEAVQARLGGSQIFEGGFAQGDSFRGIEDLIGSSFNDTLVGNLRANTLTGNAGNDFINGDNGNDTLLGGDGNDTLVGSFGQDTIDGGDGIDQARYANANSRAVVNLETGEGTAGHSFGDTLINIENLFGSNFNDVFIGDAGDNELNGWNGVDRLTGGEGNDTLIGGAGNDRFIFTDNWDDDIITDFEDGGDLLDFRTVTGVDDITDLTISTDVNGDAVITFGTDSITLLGIDVADLGGGDFLF